MEKHEDGKVLINQNQYFGNVPESVWNFYVGGYQPAPKWLKDRKGQKLTNQDLEHYQKIIATLTETEKIMKQIGQSAYKLYGLTPEEIEIVDEYK